MDFLDDIKDEVQYDHINRTLLDSNVANMLFIIYKVNFGDVDAGDHSCHGYYIIRFSSLPYTLQEDLIMDRQIVFSRKMVC